MLPRRRVRAPRRCARRRRGHVCIAVMMAATLAFLTTSNLQRQARALCTCAAERSAWGGVERARCGATLPSLCAPRDAEHAAIIFRGEAAGARGETDDAANPLGNRNGAQRTQNREKQGREKQRKQQGRRRKIQKVKRRTEKDANKAREPPQKNVRNSVKERAKQRRRRCETA